MVTETDNSADVLDIRDLIERIEELRGFRDHATVNADSFDADEAAELRTLESFVADMKGYGGDHQWEGDWYPVTLIRDSYFEDYAEELAEDIGAINRDASWPLGCIDWAKAARELQMDYSSAEYDGVTYWYR